jgi:hypothetical protein
MDITSILKPGTYVIVQVPADQQIPHQVLVHPPPQPVQQEEEEEDQPLRINRSLSTVNLYENCMLLQQFVGETIYCPLKHDSKDFIVPAKILTIAIHNHSIQFMFQFEEQTYTSLYRLHKVICIRIKQEQSNRKAGAKAFYFCKGYNKIVLYTIYNNAVLKGRKRLTIANENDDDTISNVSE